jgi:endonuclease YncB( thermonuclease family)
MKTPDVIGPFTPNLAIRDRYPVPMPTTAPRPPHRHSLRPLALSMFLVLMGVWSVAGWNQIVQMMGRGLDGLAGLIPRASADAPLGAPVVLVGLAIAIDSVTLEVEGRRVTLLGVERPDADALCPLGERRVACERVGAVALHAIVQQNPVRCAADGRDRQGNLLGLCQAGKLDLNRWQVRRGHAYASDTRRVNYRADETLARSEALGVWATSPSE